MKEYFQIYEARIILITNANNDNNDNINKDTMKNYRPIFLTNID